MALEHPTRSPFLRRLSLAVTLVCAAVAPPAFAQADANATANAAAASTPGPAPRLVGRTLHDQPVDLAALRGHVVLVYLWSTDCPVCLRQLPELRLNLQGWRGKPFDVVALNTDREPRALRDYEAILDRLAPPSAQMRLVWRGAPGHQDSFGAVPANTPTAIVLDRQGRVVVQQQGPWTPALWDRMAELVLE